MTTDGEVLIIRGDFKINMSWPLNLFLAEQYRALANNTD